MYAYDEDEDEDEDEEGEEEEDDSNNGDNGELKYSSTAPFPHAALGQALSSESIPQLESLELINIPFEVHPHHVPLLRSLVSTARVVLDRDDGSVSLATLLAEQLSVAGSDTDMSVALRRHCALQQLDITACMAAVSETLRLDIDQQPLANLSYLRWPGIHSLNRGVAAALIRISADRRWTHCMFSCAGYDETDRRLHPLFESERLSFVVESLPSCTVSELHVQSAPGSAGTFARLVTVSGAQWLLPNISLRSDEIQAVCQRVANSVTTLTIPSSKFTPVGTDSCKFPRLTVLSIEIDGDRRPTGVSKMTSGITPDFISQPSQAPGLLLNQLWIASNLKTLRLRIADSTGWICARRSAFRLPLNGQVTCEAAWEAWTTRVTAFSLNDHLVVASLQPGPDFTLVLNGVEMLETDMAQFSRSRIEKYLSARDLVYKVPAIFAHDSPAYGMYASLARSADRTM